MRSPWIPSITLIIASVVLAPGDAAARPGYRSIDGERKTAPPASFTRFKPMASVSVMAPGAGKRFHNVMSPKGIRTELTRWVWIVKSSECGGPSAGCFLQLGYIVYPTGIRKNYNLEAGLDGARDGMIRQINGTLDRSVKITYRGLPGRDVWFHARPAGAPREIAARARFFMKANKIYMVMTMSFPQHTRSKAMRSFIQSMKIR